MRARMTREEWNEVLATERATPAQVHAVMQEFTRLGLDHPGDRAGRLALTAWLLGLAEIGSTADLVMGDAGRLLTILRSAGDLDDLLPAPGPAPAVWRGPWWTDVPAQARPLLLDALQRLARPGPAIP
jgi:hypothetical protein